MSDTPRTDANDWVWTPASAHRGQPLVEEERVVDAKFARQLERELAAALKQRDEATAWRPIETAPMNGTVVMLYGHGRVTVGSWVAEHDIMVNEYDRSTGDYLGSHLSGETLPAYWQSHDGGFTEEHPPTHWMPLPQPPREKEGGGA